MRTLLTSFCLFVLCAALAMGPRAATAAPAQAVTVTDLAGVKHVVPDPSAKATVLLFVSRDCPYSNGASPEMARIADAYLQRGYAFYFVYGSPFAKADESRRHAVEYGFHAPAILDNAQVLVRAAGATTTPEAAVFDSAGKLLYHGRVDNRYDAIGVQRTAVTQHDLTDALDAISAGRAATRLYVRPVGCTIPKTGAHG